MTTTAQPPSLDDVRAGKVAADRAEVDKLELVLGWVEQHLRCEEQSGEPRTPWAAPASRPHARPLDLASGGFDAALTATATQLALDRKRRPTLGG